MDIKKAFENPGPGLIASIITSFALAAAVAGFGIVWGTLNLVVQAFG
jgi:hypothetical protein